MAEKTNAADPRRAGSASQRCLKTSLFVMRRRTFLKAALMTPISVSSLVRGDVLSQTALERGFFVDFPIEGPDYLVSDFASAYITCAKNLGANSITFDLRHRAVGNGLEYVRQPGMEFADLEVVA